MTHGWRVSRPWVSLAVSCLLKGLANKVLLFPFVLTIFKVWIHLCRWSIRALEEVPGALLFRKDKAPALALFNLNLAACDFQGTWFKNHFTTGEILGLENKCKKTTIVVKQIHKIQNADRDLQDMVESWLIPVQWIRFPTRYDRGVFSWGPYELWSLKALDMGNSLCTWVPLYFEEFDHSVSLFGRRFYSFLRERGVHKAKLLHK